MPDQGGFILRIVMETCFNIRKFNTFYFFFYLFIYLFLFIFLFIYSFFFFNFPTVQQGGQVI